jgi:hypothetical protein
MGSGASKNGSPSVAIVPQSAAADEGALAQKVDNRLPFTNFKELFTLKNYWKTVRRNDTNCSKTMLHK